MDVNEIASCFLDEFRRTHAKVDHVIDQRWIMHSLQPRLNPKEQDLINGAVQLLVDQGVVTIELRMGMKCLVLSQKGFACIYSDNKADIVEKIRADIMAEFTHTNSKVGHAIDQRWLGLTYSPTLNPVEQKYLTEAINSLETDGLIEIKQNSTILLVLTQKGFDSIY